MRIGANSTLSIRNSSPSVTGWFLPRSLAVWLVWCCSLLPSSLAADLLLRVQLIWGTDGAPPEGAKYQPLEPQPKNRLARVFKWKNYFVIHEHKCLLESQEDEKRLKLSAKCEIELKRLDDSILQIKLFGEGKWTKTVRQSVKALQRGELAVLAGDDKDNYADAWVVCISVPAR